MSKTEPIKPRATGISRFFQWWRDELAAVMPSFLLTPLLHLQQSLELSLGDEGTRVARKSGAKTADLGVYSPGGESAADLETAVRRMDHRRTPVNVHVPESLVLSRLLELPEATLENLRQVLEFEMDRQTPFQVNNVFYSYRVIERRSADKRLRVELRLVPRARVMDVLGTLTEWDMEVVNVTPEEREGGLRIGLSSRDFRQDEASGGKSLWLIVNSALVVALVAIPFWRQYETLGTLEEKLSEVKQQAEGAQALKEQLEQRIAEARFLVEKKAVSPIIVSVLNELSILLPDSTWLNRLEINSGEVHIQGVSQAASSLIELLENSPRFENAHFSSPVTQDSSGNRERFQLSVSLVAEGAS